MEVPKPVIYSMKDTLRRIDENKIRLPEFQRDFRWKLSDISELLVSMMNGFPIGTFLFWDLKESNDTIPSRPFEKVNTNGKENPPDSILVLDGQQRLSSLYQLFYSDFTKPKDRSETKFFLKIDELKNGKIDESIVYYNGKKVKSDRLCDKIEQFSKDILPLDILLFEDKLDDWKDSYSYYKASNTNKSDKREEEVQIRKNLNSSLFHDDKPVKNLIDFQFNVIELSSNTSLETVATIFEKLNSTGAPLDIFEILTAKFHKQLNVELKEGTYVNSLRDLWQKTLENENYQNIKSYNDSMRGNMFPQLIIKSILLNKGAEIKRKNMLGGRGLEPQDSLTKDDINSNWKDMTNAFDDAIKELKENYGCPSVDFLPYTTMLVPFSLALREAHMMPVDKQKDAKRKIERWYWYSIFSQRYDSSTDSKSKGDFEDLKECIRTDKPMQSISKNALIIDDLNLLEITSAGAMFTGVMNLILKNGAKDFQSSKELIRLSPKEMDIHHLYPSNLFQSDEETEMANSVLNKTMMTSQTNRVILRDQLPQAYINNLKNRDNQNIIGQLKDHFIPQQEFLSGSLQDFKGFLNKREQLIKSEIKRLIYE